MSPSEKIMENEVGLLEELCSLQDEADMSNKFGCSGNIFNIHTVWGDMDYLHWAVFCKDCHEVFIGRELYKALFFRGNPYYVIAHIMRDEVRCHCPHMPSASNIAQYLQERCSITFDGKLKIGRLLPSAPREIVNSRSYKSA